MKYSIIYPVLSLSCVKGIFMKFVISLELWNMYMYIVGHPLRKGFHAHSPKRCSTPLTMINFISHTEYHWLSGSLCTRKWTCCLLTWCFLEFSTVVMEQGSWISFKNAKAQRNWRLNVNRDYQRKSQELHWYEAVSGAIVACAVSGTFSADVWNYGRYMKLKEDMTVCRSIILLSSHLHIS